MLDPSVRPDRPLTDVLKAAADQGVRLFQYRDKRATMRDAYRQAQALRRAAEETGSLLIINDRCDLAIAVDADGVHVGQDDLPVEQARKLVGPGKLVGLSTHNAEQVMAATSAAPDYIGFGPIFSTSTKADHDPLVGINGLRQARELTTLPIFAIGGITLKTVPDLLAAGADGVAVVSAILAAPDLQDALRGFLTSLR
ncbi:MAG: thiamine phosphate synthase [Nitrospiraceae bacterium]|nr:thiamine phosphate synthase [Nitrospiraceae bacterium]